PDRFAAAAGGSADRPERKNKVGPSFFDAAASLRDRKAPFARGADPPLYQPARLFPFSSLRRLRRFPAMRPLQRLPHVSQENEAAALPLLWLSSRSSRPVPEVPGGSDDLFGHRHRAGRGRDPRPLPGGPAGPDGPRHHPKERVASSDPGGDGAGGDRHPDRDANDRQGARFSEGDPGRSSLRRSLAPLSRFPLLGADLPDADPGGGKGRPRGASGRGDHSNLSAGPREHRRRDDP